MAEPIKGNPTGKLSETARAEIAPSKREDMPPKVFLNRDDKTYPVMREVNGEWRWDCNLIRSAIRRARLNKDGTILAKAEDLYQRVCAKQGAGE